MKFKDNSRQCKAAIKKALEKGLDGSSTIVRDQAKAYSPVDTGLLRSSINKKVDGKGLKAQIGTNTEYAASVEFGTYKQSEQQYLRPAFRTKKKDCENLFKKYLSEIR